MNVIKKIRKILAKRILVSQSYLLVSGFLTYSNDDDERKNCWKEWLRERYLEKHQDLSKHGHEAFNGSMLNKYQDHLESFCRRIGLGAEGSISIRDVGAGSGRSLHPQRGTTLERSILGQSYYPEDVTPTERITNSKCDLVISTDVLEHIHFNDLPAFVERLFTLADNVFLSISCRLSHQRFITGERCHISIFRPDFWIGLVHSWSKGKNYCIVFDTPTLWGGEKIYVYTHIQGKPTKLTFSTNDLQCSGNS